MFGDRCCEDPPLYASAFDFLPRLALRDEEFLAGDLDEIDPLERILERSPF